MKLRSSLVAGVGLFAVCYTASPCFTLYRLQTALARDDTKTLNTLVDWPSVRQGIEADLAASQEDQLPLFGAGFMRKIAVKSQVTPQGVVSALHKEDPGSHAAFGISGAWVEGPGRVLLDVDGMKLRMQLGMKGWRVTRVWLPTRVLKATTFARSEEAGFSAAAH